jgi:hypothetical protein
MVPHGSVHALAASGSNAACREHQRLPVQQNKGPRDGARGYIAYEQYYSPGFGKFCALLLNSRLGAFGPLVLFAYPSVVGTKIVSIRFAAA